MSNIHASYRGNTIKYAIDDYNELKHLPKINGKTLWGTLTWQDLGLQEAIAAHIASNTLAEDVLEGFADDISDQVDAIQAEMNAFVAAGGTMEHHTTLWTGTGNYKDQAITLSAKPEDFDEIVVYASGELHHYPVDLFCDSAEGIRIKKTTLHSQVSYSSSTASKAAIAELNIKPKYNHSTCTDAQKKEFEIKHNWVWKWSGKTDEIGWQDTFLSTSPSDSNEVNVTKIIGVKYNTDAETIDARVDAWGTTHDTLGDAIRYQAKHAEPADESVTMAKFSPQVQQYMNYVSLRLDDHGGFIDTLWGAVNELDRRVTALENNNS